MKEEVKEPVKTKILKSMMPVGNKAGTIDETKDENQTKVPNLARGL